MAVLFVDGHRLFMFCRSWRYTFVLHPLHVRVTLVARLCSARYTFVLRQLCQRISSRVSIIFT